ncbi:MAG: polyphosphate kinase 1 [Bacteroidia bacterium]
MSLKNPAILFRKNINGLKFQLLNREISWLAFNARVLQEAENPDVPLLERIKFLAIFSSNLDEFFRVRVASQRRLLGLRPSQLQKLRFHPDSVLNQIQQTVIKQQTRFEHIFHEEISEGLSKEGIQIINERDVTEQEDMHLRELFKTQIFPYLTPIMISASDKAPHVKDAYIYLAVKMYKSDDINEFKYALIELPTKVCPRFYVMPATDDHRRVMLLDDVVRYNLKRVFSLFEYDRHDAYTIKITRDHELDLESDIGENLVDKINRSLKDRKKGDPVRFIYDTSMPLDLLQFLIRRLDLDKSNLIPGGRYHNFSDFMDFPDLGRTYLKYPPLPPLPVPYFDKHLRIFDAIRKRDVMVHHPYQSFDYVIRFLREAAIDPDVSSIKITLYRVAKISSVVNSLITAVMNGKEVTALVEIQARFDEETNIYWAGKLEEVGARVIYGVEGMKVHSKMCLVSRREKGKIREYAHLSTGNYNGFTARIYCDDGLFTADRRITNEINRVFKSLEKGNKQFAFRHLLVAPYYMRTRFEQLIDKEIAHAQQGETAYIVLKMNSLVDPDMIQKLYEASCAGVKIRLIVRGICCLVPGVKELSENVEVISIVDRFLEHSRVYIFGNKGNEKMYLSSADWMTRNLSHRIEVAFPILNADIRREIRDMIDLQLCDNVKARNMAAPLANQMRSPKFEGDIQIRSQYATYAYFRELVEANNKLLNEKAI